MRAPRHRINVALWSFFAVLTVTHLSLGMATAMLALRAEAWPTVQGRITSSAIGTGCGRGTGPRPDIRYEYGYQGAQYKSDRIALDTQFCGFFGADTEIVSQYSPGQMVWVHVNPKKPCQSALMVGTVQAITIRSLALSALFLSLCAYWLVKTWRRRRRC